MAVNEKDLLKYIKGVGIDIHTSTKARGNQGFYMKNRIDISKNISKERFIPTLLHEFTHFIHSQLEPFMERTGGTIEKIFDDNESKFYLEELISVTKFVDKNSKFEKLNEHKQLIKDKILEYEDIIKNKYPKFQRSKKFTEFESYIKRSEAKYLMRYDRVKLITKPFSKQTKTYCIENIENDFTDMPKEFAAYIRLNSCKRKQSRISSKISRLKKYYSKPTELFARFVEGLYINPQQVKILAPNCYKRFFDLLDSGYYRELREIVHYFMSNNE